MWNGHHHSLRLFSSLCALDHALPPAVDAWFQVPSFAFTALASSTRTVLVPVASWFRTRYRISSTFPVAFALLKHSPYVGRLLLLHFALFEQLGCPLGSCYCSRSRSLLGLGCLTLHSLLVACLCLYVQANDSPNLL